MVMAMRFNTGWKWCCYFWKSKQSGVTQGTAKDTLLATYNDINSVDN